MCQWRDHLVGTYLGTGCFEIFALRDGKIEKLNSKAWQRSQDFKCSFDSQLNTSLSLSTFNVHSLIFFSSEFLIIWRLNYLRILHIHIVRDFFFPKRFYWILWYMRQQRSCCFPFFVFSFSEEGELQCEYKCFDLLVTFWSSADISWSHFVVSYLMD